MNSQFIHKSSVNSVFTLLICSLIGSSATPSFAGQFAQNHPRRAQVLNRDARLNQRITGDLGHLNGNYGKLENQDLSIMHQEQRDARINGGYITHGQQAQLNREENHLSNEVRNDYNPNQVNNGQFAQNHPRRAQVLGQDASMNQQINQDRGNLGGHYWGLENADNHIMNQEQRDARMNGGYITTGQQQHLDQEEANLQNRINTDYHPPVTQQ